MAREFQVGLAAPSGSAGAPSFTFSTDDDTGLYSESADSIGFSAGGAAVASLGSDGLTVLGDVVHGFGTSRRTAMMDLEVLTWMN